MTLFKLTPFERQKLFYLADHTPDAVVLRRAQALLWLDDGECVIEVAERLGASRQVIYQWIARYLQDTPVDLATRLSVGPRTGRPSTTKGIIDPFIDEAIDHDPRMFGFNSTVWTAPLLSQYLTCEYGLSASVSSVKRAIAHLRIRWKRPRHHLSLRPKTWRQAKGGLKRG
jgi:putative transposase